MGFVPLEHEYKLMGMAPYASDRAATEMARIFANYLHLDAGAPRISPHARFAARTTWRRVCSAI